MPSEPSLVNCLDCDKPIGIEDSWEYAGLCHECWAIACTRLGDEDEWEDATIADDNYNDYGIIDCR